MMFGYADDRVWWQAGLRSIAMTALWGLPIWAIYSLITGAARSPAPGPGIESTAAERGASWTGAWPAARSAPVRTGGSAMNFPPAKAAALQGGGRHPRTAVADGTVRA